jgi:ABC-type transport system substrate-binding protein
MDPDASDQEGSNASPVPGRGGRLPALRTVVLVFAMIGVAGLAVITVTPRPEPSLRPQGAEVVVLGSAPVAWDPARIADAGTAATLAQVFEGLTAFDLDTAVRPALATSWELSDGGRRLNFSLRPGLAFSDGTPITAADVVRSWLRVIDPAAPSPLADLLGEVVGAREYLDGEADAEDVGLRGDGDQVIVSFLHPAAWFPAAAASPTLAVVPASLTGSTGPAVPDGLVASGAYLPAGEGATDIRLAASDRYWAGRPSIPEIALVTDTEGDSPVDRFRTGAVDYAPIGSDDASWIRYDRDLGPQLRRSDDLSVELIGFDTIRPPFNDVRVRRAFAKAVDWDRLVLLDDPDAVAPTSLLPIGIPGRGDEDFSPVHDPDAAREELAAAGFPGGTSFPEVTLATYGSPFALAVADQLEAELGVSIVVEARPFGDFNELLDDDPPDMWSLDWIADYPHAQDFLGLLLGSRSRNNVAGWSDPEFDAALEAAASTPDMAEQERHYAEAQRIVLNEVPLIPVRYGVSWALSRERLLGGQPSGLGIVRFAGLAWAPE